MVLVEKPEGKSHLGDPVIDGRIILRWIFRRDLRLWTRSIWLRIRNRWRAFVNAVMNLRVP
jgi:hypothetical protein